MLSRNYLLHSRYRIIRPLGKGGFGQVYEALDDKLDCIVALKERLAKLDSEKLRRAFEREAKLLANLRHPALPKVTDHFFEVEGQYLVMEFIEGDDLATLLAKRQSPFPFDQVLSWADEVLKALAYLHTRSEPIVHRDIKPANIKLTSEGEIFLLDFGLAKGYAGEMTLPGSNRSSSVHGYTAAYAPLEQLNNSGTNEQSDIYSLGATLYHLLTEHIPVTSSQRYKSIEMGEHDPLQPPHEVNPTIPEPISVVVLQAMALSRRDRIRSAYLMRDALLKAKLSLQQEAAVDTMDSSWQQAPTSVAPASNAHLRIGPETATRDRSPAELEPPIPSPADKLPAVPTEEISWPSQLASEGADSKWASTILDTETDTDSFSSSLLGGAETDSLCVTENAAIEYPSETETAWPAQQEEENARLIKQEGEEKRQSATQAKRQVEEARPTQEDAELGDAETPVQEETTETTKLGTISERIHRSDSALTATAEPFLQTPEDRTAEANVLAGLADGASEITHLANATPETTVEVAEVINDGPAGERHFDAVRLDATVPIVQRRAEPGYTIQVAQSIPRYKLYRNWLIAGVLGLVLVLTASLMAVYLSGKKSNVTDSASTPPVNNLVFKEVLSSQQGKLSSVALSRDARLLAFAGDSKTISVWDAQTLQLKHATAGHQGIINSIAFSPDNYILASGASDRSVKLWNAADGSLLKTLSGHLSRVLVVAFSPSGRLLATAGEDKKILLWEVKSGNLAKSLSGHRGPVSALAFASDGTTLASAGKDDGIKLWDIPQGFEKKSLPAPGTLSLAFSPDGILASSHTDGTARLWNWGNKLILAKLVGHTASVTAIAFNSDGRLLFTASADKTVRIWNVENGVTKQTLIGHTEGVDSIAISPDGHTLLTGSHDQTLRVWKTN